MERSLALRVALVDGAERGKGNFIVPILGAKSRHSTNEVRWSRQLRKLPWQRHAVCPRSV